MKHTTAATFIGMAALLPFHPAPLRVSAGPEDIKMACLGARQPISLKDLRGRIVALHFLGVPDSPAATELIKTYSAAASSLAGTGHVFVHTGSHDAFLSWCQQFKAGSPLVVFAHDEGGALAREFDLPVPASGVSRPATIVLDPAGKEVFRHVGTRESDVLGWKEFAKRVEDTTRASALADYNLPRGNPLAVDGYDVVAYFTDNKATKGDKLLASRYRGVEYRFATQEHREQFARDPDAFVPTYGGWCASAMGAKGTKVSIDPTNFKVAGGRLFLFYKDFFSDALKDWNKHDKEWEPAADDNWKKLTGEGPIKPGPAAPK
jgi:YHS domain-containing protein